jgi:sporulation transcriptional regulator SpoIIID
MNSGVVFLKSNIEERACELAEYIIENKATVRAAAKKFGISKSTVHKDISERLEQFNRSLFLGVKEVLEKNKAERHIRGGIATRKKYKGEQLKRISPLVREK